MRILLVAPFNTAKYRGRRFDFFGRRLANGFIRNGHFVVNFSDRDSVRNALGIRAIGEPIARYRLIEIASYMRPDLICLHTFDIISPETIRRIKKILPNCRVAPVYCDALLDPVRAANFSRWLPDADFAFATSGGDCLSPLSKYCPVAFIPNPIDLSVDMGKAFAEPANSFDVFCGAGINGIAKRWGLIDELTRLKPHLKYSLHGRGKQNRLWGDDYIRAIIGSKIGLNVNQYEGDLYASDRMAQYLGNGLLLATYRIAGFQRYFGGDEMIFFDSAMDLGEQIEHVIADDRKWRAMAERAYKKAIVMMNIERVTEFIVRMTMGEGPQQDWAFMEEIYPGARRQL
jgi:hypothetical protein